jgi:hypothetical protein
MSIDCQGIETAELKEAKDRIIKKIEDIERLIEM